jgi:hypothetical protein
VGFAGEHGMVRGPTAAVEWAGAVVFYRQFGSRVHFGHPCSKNTASRGTARQMISGIGTGESGDGKEKRCGLAVRDDGANFVPHRPSLLPITAVLEATPQQIWVSSLLGRFRFPPHTH